MATYTSYNMDDGKEFDDSVGKVVKYLPQTFTYIRLKAEDAPIDLAEYFNITVDSFGNPSDPSKVGFFFIDSFVNGPTEYTKTQVNISCMIMNYSNMYVPYLTITSDGKTWGSGVGPYYKWGDVSNAFYDVVYETGTTPPSLDFNSKQIWVDISDPRYVDLKEYDETLEEWVSILKTDDGLLISDYDTTGQSSDIFAYADQGILELATWKEDIGKHIRNELQLIHLTQEEKDGYNTVLNAEEIDALIESTYKAYLRTYIYSEYNRITNFDEVSVTGEELLINITEHMGDTHVSTDKIADWDSKASSIHSHNLDGRVEIDGADIISGVIPQSMLPQELLERIYRLESVDEFADPSITPEEKATKYKNGNQFFLETGSYSFGTEELKTANSLAWSTVNINNTGDPIADYVISGKNVCIVNGNVTTNNEGSMPGMRHLNLDNPTVISDCTFTGLDVEPSTVHWVSVCANGSTENPIFVAISVPIEFTINVDGTDEVVLLPYIATSTNGLAWTVIDNTFLSSTNTEFGRIVFCNNRFVMFGYNTRYLVWSEDGTNWTVENTLPIQANWRGMAFSDDFDLPRYMLIGYKDDNSGLSYISSDLITWTASQSVSNYRWIDVVYEGSKFLLIADSNNLYGYTYDGKYIETNTLPNDLMPVSLATSKGKTVMATGGKEMLFSINGLVWEVEEFKSNTVDIVHASEDNFLALDSTASVFDIAVATSIVAPDLTWYRIIDNTYIGTDQYMEGVIEIVMGTSETTFERIRNKPTNVLNYPVEDLYDFVVFDQIMATLDVTFKTKLEIYSNPETSNFTGLKLEYSPENIINMIDIGRVGIQKRVSGTKENDMLDENSQLDIIVRGTDGTILKSAYNTLDNGIDLENPYYEDLMISNNEHVIDHLISNDYGIHKDYNTMISNDKVVGSGNNYDYNVENLMDWDGNQSTTLTNLCRKTNVEDLKFIKTDGNIGSDDGSHFFEYGNGVAVRSVDGTQTNQILVSKDFITWETVEIPFQYQFLVGLFDGNKFIITGRSTNYGAYSYNGFDWVYFTLPMMRDWLSLVKNNGIYILGGNSNDGSYLYSDNGIDWDKKSFTINSQIYRNVYSSNDKFVTFGINQGSSDTNITWNPLYSYDGITWEAGTVDFSNIGMSDEVPLIPMYGNMIYSNGKYLTFITNTDNDAHVYQHIFILSSTNGINWEVTVPEFDINKFTPATALLHNKLSYCNGLFILGAMHGNTDNQIYLSEDGKCWRTVDLLSDSNYLSGYLLYDGKIITMDITTGNIYEMDLGYGTPLPTIEYPYKLPDEYEVVGPMTFYQPLGVYGDDKYVQLTYTSNQVLYSVDGISWNTSLLPDVSGFEFEYKDAYIEAFAYFKGKFIAILSLTHLCFTSSDGIGWEITGVGGGIFSCIAHNNEIIVSLDREGGSRGIYSTDGIIWDETTLPISGGNWFTLAYGDGKFVALCNGTSKGIYSTDGINWTEMALPTFGSNIKHVWFNLVYFKDKFIALCEGTNKGIYSTDGINWTEMNLPIIIYKSSSQLYNTPIADAPIYIYDNILYVYNRDLTNRVRVSTVDGINWTIDPNSPLKWFSGGNIMVGPDKLVFISPNSKDNSITVSYDGINWEYNTIYPDTIQAIDIPELKERVYDKEKNLYIGFPLKGQYVYSSNDLITWTQKDISSLIPNTITNTEMEITELLNVKGIFYTAIKNSNKLLYSKDGINWLTKDISISKEWTSFAYGNGQFVLAYNENTFIFSSDLETWEEGRFNSASIPPFYVMHNLLNIQYDKYNKMWYGKGIDDTSYQTNISKIDKLYIWEDSDTNILWTRVFLEKQDWDIEGITSKVLLVKNTKIIDNTPIDEVANLVNLPIDGRWHALSYGNDKFVALSRSSNDGIYSTDGNDWTEMTLLRTTGNWRTLSYGNDKFVSLDIGFDNGVYSTDGNDWTEMSLPVSGNWEVLIYGVDKFVALARNTNKGIYSINGINWNTITLPISGDWYTLSYGNDKFVALKDASNQGIYSYDGINWNTITLPISGNWPTLSYGNDKFVALSYGSTQGIYSYDGINWTEISLPISNSWLTLVYGNDKFVALSYGSTQGIYSYDGINWNTITLPISGDWRTLSYGDSKFVALDEEGSKLGIYSYDGINWTTTIYPQLQEPKLSNDNGETWETVYMDPESNFIDKNNKIYKLPTSNIPEYKYTEDGKTWVECNNTGIKENILDLVETTNGVKLIGEGKLYDVMSYEPYHENVTFGDITEIPISKVLTLVAYGNNKIVAFPYNDGTPVYSTDGITWTEITMPVTGSWNSLTYGDGKFIVLRQGYSEGYYSTDGITWTEMSRGVGGTFGSLSYGDGKFVALQSANIISGSALGIYSTNGINWTQITNLPTNDRGWYPLTYGGGKFVAFDGTYDSGLGIYSTDGITWTEMSLPISWGAGMVLTYGDDKFVALSHSSTKGIYSTDGITWTEMSLPISGTWDVLNYVDGKFIALSLWNVGIFSTDGITWTEMSIPHKEHWLEIVQIDDRLIAIGDSVSTNFTIDVNDKPLSIMNSTSNRYDDFEWDYGRKSGWEFEEITLPISGSGFTLAYGDDKFVAIAQPNGSTQGCYSYDGNIWNEFTLPISGDWRALTYGNGKFVAINSGGSGVYSTDGINWNEMVNPIGVDFGIAMAYGGDKFVFVPFESNVGENTTAAYSTDGINWSTTTIPFEGQFYNVVYGNGKFVSVADVTGETIYSYNGITWYRGQTLSELYRYTLVYGNGMFITLSTAGKCAYSTNGTSWTEIDIADVSGSVYGLTYDDSLKYFIATTGSNANGALYSSDGITWTEFTLPKSGHWFKTLSDNNGRFVFLDRTLNSSTALTLKFKENQLIPPPDILPSPAFIPKLTECINSNKDIDTGKYTVDKNSRIELMTSSVEIVYGNVSSLAQNPDTKTIVVTTYQQVLDPQSLTLYIRKNGVWETHTIGTPIVSGLADGHSGYSVSYYKGTFIVTTSHSFMNSDASEQLIYYSEDDGSTWASNWDGDNLPFRSKHMVTQLCSNGTNLVSLLADSRNIAYYNEDSKEFVLSTLNTAGEGAPLYYDQIIYGHDGFLALPGHRRNVLNPYETFPNPVPALFTANSKDGGKTWNKVNLPEVESNYGSNWVGTYGNGIYVLMDINDKDHVYYSENNFEWIKIKSNIQDIEGISTYDIRDIHYSHGVFCAYIGDKDPSMLIAYKVVSENLIEWTILNKEPIVPRTMITPRSIYSIDNAVVNIANTNLSAYSAEYEYNYVGKYTRKNMYVGMIEPKTITKSVSTIVTKYSAPEPPPLYGEWVALGGRYIDIQYHQYSKRYFGRNGSSMAMSGVDNPYEWSILRSSETNSIITAECFVLDQSGPLVWIYRPSNNYTYTYNVNTGEYKNTYTIDINLVNGYDVYAISTPTYKHLYSVIDQNYGGGGTTAYSTDGGSTYTTPYNITTLGIGNGVVYTNFDYLPNGHIICFGFIPSSYNRTEYSIGSSYGRLFTRYYHTSDLQQYIIRAGNSVSSNTLCIIPSTTSNTALIGSGNSFTSRSQNTVDFSNVFGIGDNEFIAFDNNTTYISNDGIVWTTRSDLSPSPAKTNGYKISYCDTNYIFIAGDSQTYVNSSNISSTITINKTTPTISKTYSHQQERAISIVNNKPVIHDINTDCLQIYHDRFGEIVSIDTRTTSTNYTNIPRSLLTDSYLLIPSSQTNGRLSYTEYSPDGDKSVFWDDQIIATSISAKFQGVFMYEGIDTSFPMALTQSSNTITYPTGEVTATWSNLVLPSTGTNYSLVNTGSGNAYILQYVSSSSSKVIKTTNGTLWNPAFDLDTGCQYMLFNETNNVTIIMSYSHKNIYRFTSTTLATSGMQKLTLNTQPRYANIVNGVFYFISSTGILGTSKDGLNWEEIQLPSITKDSVSTIWTGISYIEGEYVLTSGNQFIRAISTDMYYWRIEDLSINKQVTDYNYTSANDHLYYYPVYTVTDPTNKLHIAYSEELWYLKKSEIVGAYYPNWNDPSSDLFDTVPHNQVILQGSEGNKIVFSRTNEHISVYNDYDNIIDTYYYTSMDISNVNFDPFRTHKLIEITNISGADIHCDIVQKTLVGRDGSDIASMVLLYNGDESTAALAYYGKTYEDSTRIERSSKISINNRSIAFGLSTYNKSLDQYFNNYISASTTTTVDGRIYTNPEFVISTGTSKFDFIDTADEFTFDGTTVIYRKDRAIYGVKIVGTDFQVGSFFSPRFDFDLNIPEGDKIVKMKASNGTLLFICENQDGTRYYKQVLITTRLNSSLPTAPGFNFVDVTNGMTPEESLAYFTERFPTSTLVDSENPKWTTDGYGMSQVIDDTNSLKVTKREYDTDLILSFDIKKGEEPIIKLNADLVIDHKQSSYYNAIENARINKFKAIKLLKEGNTEL